MKIKKLFLFTLFLFNIGILIACSSKSEFYFAQIEPTESSQWVSYVIVEKKRDKIVDAKWSAFHVAGELAGYNYLSKKNYDGRDKYTQAQDSIYIMHADELTGKRLKWNEQADVLVKKLIETQDYNDRLPVPAGASIGTDDFYKLVEKALSLPAIKKGNYQDGFHYLTLKEKAKPTGAPKYWDPIEEKIVTTANLPDGKLSAHTFGSFVVVNGSIVLAYYNSAYDGHLIEMDPVTHKAVKFAAPDGKSYSVIRTKKTVITSDVKTEENVQRENKDTGEIIVTTEQVTKTVTVEKIEKMTTLRNTKNQLGYSYQMKKPNAGGSFEYFEAAQSAGNYLIEHQNFDVDLTEKGKTDAVSGVTITAADFKTIAEMIPLK